jgi:hypothetical protein
MFGKIIAIAAVAAFANAADLPKPFFANADHMKHSGAVDEGFMAGAMKGFMLTNEHEMKGCHKPKENAMVKQAESMLPMAEMMVKNMYEGKEPKWFKSLKDSEHTIAIMASMVMEKYEDTEFCKGMILAFEGRKVAMLLAGELFSEASKMLF